MAAAEEFIFDVEEEASNSSDWPASYRLFVERLCRSFLVSSHAFFVIALRTKSHQTKLIINPHSFQLLGYQMENSNRWFQFRSVLFADDDDCTCEDEKNNGICDEGHIIKGSVIMKWGGAYCRSLERYYWSLERGADGDAVDGISIGQQQLVIAVNLLATSTCDQDRITSVIVVSLMICEGCRFPWLANHIATTFPDNLPLPPWMHKAVSRYQSVPTWSIPDPYLSEDSPNLETDDPDPTVAQKKGRRRKGKGAEFRNKLCGKTGILKKAEARSQDIPDPDPIQVNTILESDAINPDPGTCEDSPDLIMDNPFQELDPDEIYADMKLKVRHFNSDDEYDEYDESTHSLLSGFAMAEVFSVRVIDVFGEHSSRFEGMITMRRRGPFKLYDCIYKQGEKSESGHLGYAHSPSVGALTVFATINFYIHFCISHEKVAYSLEWDPHDRSHDEASFAYYNFDGYCSLRVDYIVLRKASQTAIEVSLVDEGRKGHPARVYGLLSACYGDFNYETVIFQRTANESMDACPGEQFELLRDVICLPYNSPFTIRAELYEQRRHMDDDDGFDDEIARGTMEFPINDNGEFEQCVSKECGKIRVRVMWGCDGCNDNNTLVLLRRRKKVVWI